MYVVNQAGRQSTYYQQQQPSLQRSISPNPNQRTVHFQKARTSISGPTPTYQKDREQEQNASYFSEQGNSSNPSTTKPQQQPQHTLTLGDSPNAQYQIQIQTRTCRDFSNDANQVFADFLFYIPSGGRTSDNAGTGNSCIRFMAIFVVWILVIFTFPFAFWLYFHVINEYERAVIFRMGTIAFEDRSLEPGYSGIFFTLPCIETFRKVDMRTNCISIPAHDVLTQDDVSLKVECLVCYRIINAVLSITQVSDPHISATLLAQSILRRAISARTLTELITHKETLADELCNSLQAVTTSWGVRIEKVCIKEFILPPEIQKALYSEVEIKKLVKTNLIAAEGEKQTAKVLKEAADILSTSPDALQLRYIQALSTITSGQNRSTLLLPLPLDFLGIMPHRHARGHKSPSVVGAASVK